MDANRKNAELVQEVLQAEREWVEAHRRLDVAAQSTPLAGAEGRGELRCRGVILGRMFTSSANT